jgi:pyruvate dehydrogenase E2 component (dihydrolipoamide acetyltransferase)
MQYVDCGGRRLRHCVLGDGRDAVVLVHGFGGRIEHWSENQSALAASGRTVAALDLPGHGESSTDVGSGSLEELASGVLQYMAAVGIDRAHLVGHSMGAAVSLVMADLEPARVQSLTLVGPAGTGQKINADFIRGFIAARGRDELGSLMRLLFADPQRIPEAWLQQAAAYKQRPGVVEALTRIASSRYGGTPAGHALRDVMGTVPTLVIWGGADAIIPPPAPGELMHAGTTLHVLPGRGHMVQIEAADQVNRLIDDFLRR